MSKKAERENAQMLSEYDFSGGVRGKYVEQLKAGSNLVVIEPELSREFPDSEAVNKALRVYLRTTKSRDGAA